MPLTPVGLFEVGPAEAPGRWSWSPHPTLFTPSGFLQGGAALGVALATLQLAAGRPVVWANAQFVSFATVGSTLDFAPTIVATGRLTTQARCCVSRSGTELLTLQGALGARAADHDGTWVRAPSVLSPHACPAYVAFAAGRGDLGDLVEMRLAQGRTKAQLDGVRGEGALALWVRFLDGADDLSAPRLSVIGDFMPLVFAEALGIRAYGNSLDITIRLGPQRAGRWVLLDIHAHQVHNGVGSARAFLWGEDGALLADISQSAIVRLGG